MTIKHNIQDHFSQRNNNALHGYRNQRPLDYKYNTFPIEPTEHNFRDEDLRRVCYFINQSQKQKFKALKNTFKPVIISLIHD